MFASTDGSLPDCLLIGLDPRAIPAECVRRVPGEGHHSGLCRNHPGEADAGGDRPLLLSQTSAKPAQVTVSEAGLGQRFRDLSLGKKERQEKPLKSRSL